MSSGSCLSTKAMRLAYNKSLVSYCHHTIAGYLHAHFPPLRSWKDSSFTAWHGLRACSVVGTGAQYLIDLPTLACGSLSSSPSLAKAKGNHDPEARSVVTHSNYKTTIN